MAGSETEPVTDEQAARIAAVKDAHSSWAAAYESIRPTGEVDSRAKLVLVSSLVLIALCLATEKPDSINVLGFTFRAREWLILGLPLTLVVVYSTVQLILAWTVQRAKIEHSIFTPIVSIQAWITSMMTAQIEKGRKFIEEAQEMSRRRAEIQEWYEAQSSARWDEIHEEYERRRRDAGLIDHEKKVDIALDDFVAGRKPPDLLLAEDALKDFRRVIRIRKARSLLDLVVPVAVAFLALYIFTISVVSPTYLNSLGSYLSKGR